MTILVTGSAGHLGEALMRSLRAGNRPALGLDVTPTPFTDRVASITDRDAVRRCLRGIDTVIHAATLHKPHVATHSNQSFIDTNVTGTLVLLEEAVTAGVRSFVFTSTTSAFGLALTPAEGEPAAWIGEDVAPLPKNIYGVTKLAAETLCELFFRKHGLPTIVLRAARFFPEADDDPAVRERYETPNVQVNELLHRRVDLQDAVDAHLLAAERAPGIGFGRYILSATTPFRPEHRVALRQDAAAVVRGLFPDADALFAARGWSLFPRIDRVYVNDRARRDLGWRPAYDFRRALDALKDGGDVGSPLARAVGSKGYHGDRFEDGPYPVA